jgi:hypothetical protein
MKYLLLSTFFLSFSTLNAQTASYLIPAGKLLSQDVSLPMTKAQFKVHKGEAQLVYELPKFIDGPTPQRFKLKGPAESFPAKLTSSKVNATCSEIEESISCVMEYNKNQEGLFLLDHEGAAALIDADLSLSNADVALLKQAGVALSHEALGIITLKKKK